MEQKTIRALSGDFFEVRGEAGEVAPQLATVGLGICSPRVVPASGFASKNLGIGGRKKVVQGKTNIQKCFHLSHLSTCIHEVLKVANKTGSHALANSSHICRQRFHPSILPFFHLSILSSFHPLPSCLMFHACPKKGLLAFAFSLLPF